MDILDRVRGIFREGEPAGDHIGLEDFEVFGGVEAKLHDGVDPNVADEDGVLPLAWAIQRKDRDALDALIRAGVDVHAEVGDQAESWLHVAAENGFDEGIPSLFAAGLDPNQWDLVGRTPLKYSITANDTGSVEALVAGGAAMEPKDGNQPVLHDAVRAGRPESVSKLLELGADPNARVDSGETPLHSALETFEHHATGSMPEAKWTAAMDRIAENVSILLEYGADPAAKNNDGLTPLDSARQWAGARLGAERLNAVPPRADWAPSVNGGQELRQRMFGEEAPMRSQQTHRQRVQL